ncbi:hypothetical protein E4U60_006955 [Claviceps pazoutovae]|uniref:Uncharacterized protein n=1 Tax=Claviceps pazoutovae TaxID=1649127 RepID=A0A9P7MG28_9HYPO|nr:hypothetical protein E4U60_006955 [Claviceps pazoutovae]
MMAPPFFWVSAFLALNYGFAQANPDAMEAAPVATMNIQPVKMLTELPVFIRTHCPRPTKIVICHGKTLTVHRPGLFKTVVTLTYEEVKTRSRLNCGRRTATTKTTLASSAIAIEETPSSSGPITNDLTSSTESVSAARSEPGSSTESVFPGSFTTSPTTQSAPEISESGSNPSDNEKGDRYTSASNSASSPPGPESSRPGKPFQGKFTSQPSPSSRINIDTAKSHSSQTPFPSATTKTYGDYGDVPGTSVSEPSSSIVSLSDGSHTATFVQVQTKARSESIGSTDRAGRSESSHPSATTQTYGDYGDVPGTSVSEPSSSIVSLSDGSRTATFVQVQTKARSESIGSTYRARSSQASPSEPSGSSPGQGSSSKDYVSSSREAMITTHGVPQSSSTSTDGTVDVGSPVQPRPQTKVAPPSSFDEVVTEEPSSTSLTSSSTGVQPSSSKSSFTQSDSATSSLQSDSVGPSSFDSSAIVQSSSASSLGVKSDGDLPSISKGAVLSTPSPLERVKAGTSSSGANTEQL